MRYALIVLLMCNSCGMLSHQPTAITIYNVMPLDPPVDDIDGEACVAFEKDAIACKALLAI